MTEFNPDGKEVLTSGESLGPAMSITNQADADQYLEALAAHLLKCGEDIVDLREAERVARHNLAYYAGYFDPATRLRVEQLFRAEHPIFGSSAAREKA